MEDVASEYPVLLIHLLFMLLINKYAYIRLYLVLYFAFFPRQHTGTYLRVSTTILCSQQLKTIHAGKGAR